MLHDILIALHTITALVALAAGVALIYRLPQTADQNGLFQLYWISLIVMVGSLLAVIVVDWPQLDPPTQIIFAGLGLLALYMLVRGYQARTTLQEKPVGWEQGFVDHVGFTLISLFVGFIAISVLNQATWVIIASVVISILVGIQIVNAFKRRLA